MFYTQTYSGGLTGGGLVSIALPVAIIHRDNNFKLRLQTLAKRVAEVYTFIRASTLFCHAHDATQHNHAV